MKKIYMLKFTNFLHLLKFLVILINIIFSKSFASVTILSPMSEIFVTGNKAPKDFDDIFSPELRDQEPIVIDYGIIEKVIIEHKGIVKTLIDNFVKTYTISSNSKMIESLFVADYIKVIRIKEKNYLIDMPSDKKEFLPNMNYNYWYNFYFSNFGMKLFDNINLAINEGLMEKKYNPDDYIFAFESSKIYSSKENNIFIEALADKVSLFLIPIETISGHLRDNLAFNNNLILACEENLVLKDNKRILELLGGGRKLISFSKEQVKANALDVKFVVSDGNNYLLVNKDSYALWTLEQKTNILGLVKVIPLDFTNFSKYFSKKIRHLVIDTP